MSFTRKSIPLTRLICAVLALQATAWGQSSTNTPEIGYLYPAGGQQGTTVRVTASGQFLNGVTDAYVSGQGVQASIIRYYRPLTNLQREQRQLLQARLRQVRDMRLAELAGKEYDPNATPAATSPEPAGTPEVKMPEHPLLYDLENKSLPELAHIATVLLGSRAKQQPNRQIAESVLIKIRIDPNAKPGNRELRLATRAGLTNPVVFQVGTLPEVRELESGDRQMAAALAKMPEEKPFDLPVLLNGQITPGDTDRFRFLAKQGQRLVIDVQARRLIPYLADAVPGWFQATVTLYDAKGKEVAFADDYRFDPDPVLFYEVPADGEYELEIHDALYRGRDDFVYRIAVGEQPFVTEVFPLGGRAGVETTASISGWNLATTRLPLDTTPGDDLVRHTMCQEGKCLSNDVVYAVDTLPEYTETESNDAVENAQQIELPAIVNGRIAHPGDVDVFQLKCRAGDVVVAEVVSRRLNSPLDSLVWLTDASNHVLQRNDDYVLEDNHLYEDAAGLLTHHADSYLMTKLPKDGTYYVHIGDAQHHGGQAYAYRLRISAPQPDFALRATPSGLSVNAGGVVPICVYALRKDGFDGEIEVALKDAPAGFSLTGARIPPGRDRVRLTLTAPAAAPAQPVAFHLEGTAKIGGQVVHRPIVPAEDRMQAFLYRHLVPSQELLVCIQKTRWPMPPVRLAGDGPVRIPVGGAAQVLLKTPRRPIWQDVQLELEEPPGGVTLHDVTLVPEGLTFRLQADKDAAHGGLVDNLIVHAYREVTPAPQEGKPAPQKRRASVGVLPAIPIEIVQQ
jgi:hypothetical protein